MTMASYHLVPDYVERKGSLCLRSNQMNYSRAVLISNWQQAREAEPRDYDMSLDEVRDLTRSTYHRIAEQTDGSTPKSTYTHMTDQLKLKKDFTEREVTKHMINEHTVDHVDLDRDTGRPKTGFGAVLPRHHPDFYKMHLQTTNCAHFKPPYDYTPRPEIVEECAPANPTYKKCNSQFTDTADYRRPGRNTFHDESGHYANQHLKCSDPFYKSGDPILAAFK